MDGAKKERRDGGDGEDSGSGKSIRKRRKGSTEV